MLHNSDGSEAFTPPHYPLLADKARFVGEAVAMVVAETLLAAKDGAEQVEVDYEILPAVIETAAARQDAPRVHEGARSNVCVDAEIGDATATTAAFARAAHVARFETWVRRVTGVPMELRAVLAAYEAGSGRYTVYAGNGGAVGLKNDVAAILDIPADKVRVLMQDVGGNFGTRGMIYPEFALAAWASRRVGRPVKWICERHGSFLSDYQAHDLVAETELALDAQGNFLAMRGANLGNLGAHSTNFGMVQKGSRSCRASTRARRAFSRVRRAQQQRADPAVP
jgi:carbon-monoxide dehydrogenase large subunit